jgi:hypothetical protein
MPEATMHLLVGIAGFTVGAMRTLEHPGKQ